MMLFKEMDLYLVKSFKMGKANELCIHTVNFTDGSFNVVWQGHDENWSERTLRHVTYEDAVVYDVVMLSDAELLAIMKVRRSLMVKIKKAKVLRSIFKAISIFLLFMVVVINLLLSGEYTLGVGLICGGIIYIAIRYHILAAFNAYQDGVFEKHTLVLFIFSGLFQTYIGIDIFISFLANR